MKIKLGKNKTFFRDSSSFGAPVWCLIWGPYLYIKPNLIFLTWQIITEWNNDKHLVG